MSIEQNVYYWDFIAYHDSFNQLGALLIESPIQALIKLKNSIETDDYGMAILVPLMPFQILFGGSRLSFIVAVVTIYLIPTALFVARLSYLEAVTTTQPSRGWLAVWIAALLYTPFWAATLRGWPDIAGCLALLAATYFLWKPRFLTREPVISGICVGVCLWLAFMLRRWYAYSVVGLLISAALFCLLQAARDREFSTLWRAALGAACAICVIVAAALTFQLPLISKILATNYGDLYSGYRTNFASQIDQFGARLSYANWLLIGTGLYLSITRRNRFSLFCAVASALTFLLFVRTQDPDRHHSMPMFLWLFPAYAQAIVAIVSMPALRWRWANAVMVVVAGLAFLGAFFPMGRQLLSPISYFFAREATLPLHLDNLAEYRRLVDDLVKKGGTGDSFSVFASGAIMSDSLLLSMNPVLYNYVILSCQIDSRDQFQPESLKSKYIVVTNPPIIHRQPDAQICVTLPDQHIVQGTGIGAAYRRITTYQLSGNVTGYLYEQVRPVSKTEIDALYSEFREKYPSWTTPEW
ncbi:hypothetical protein [Mesorhizobium sp. INR15]|uniref:hypothetical protein n=1 Tax=Mesorhizobium sp. INR15 TaxID=2654248 RepID=UPI0021563CE7|nr:hypothetical protein [Mesorhizobium sp. INR15]